MNIQISCEAKYKLRWTVRINEECSDKWNLFLGLSYDFNSRNFCILGDLWCLQNQKKLAWEWRSSRGGFWRRNVELKKKTWRPWHKKMFTTRSAGLQLIRPDTETSTQLSLDCAHPFLHERCILERKVPRGRHLIKHPLILRYPKPALSCSCTY